MAARLARREAERRAWSTQKFLKSVLAVPRWAMIFGAVPRSDLVVREPQTLCPQCGRALEAGWLNPDGTVPYRCSMFVRCDYLDVRRGLAGAIVEADNAAPVQLLADLRDLFGTTPADQLATAAIISQLTALEDRPWADYAQGHPITPRHLARLLEGFRIKAKQIRQGADNARKGYLRSDFTDAFCRYLPRGPKHPKQRRRAGELPVHRGPRQRRGFA